MDELLAAYGDGASSGESSSSAGVAPGKKIGGVSASGGSRKGRRSAASALALPPMAPSVKSVALVPTFYHDTRDKSVQYNLPTSAMYAPVYGPKHPLDVASSAQGAGAGVGAATATHSTNLPTGHAVSVAVDGITFETQHRTYDGQAAFEANPYYAQMYGREAYEEARLKRAQELQSRAMPGISAAAISAAAARANGKPKKRKRIDADTTDTVSEAYMGPWGAREGEVIDEEVEVDALLEAQVNYLREQRGVGRKGGSNNGEDGEDGEQGADKDEQPDAKRGRWSDDRGIEESSKLHIPEIYDYQGRSFLYPPVEVRSAVHGKNYVPKKLLHTWTGHNKGVSAIRLFPESGHLLLSGSMDFKVKLWRVYDNKQCVRTFTGHTLAVRDVDFNRDGTRFASAGYDRYVRIWDTETGQCINRIRTHKTPNCVRFNPNPDMANEILVADAGAKITQWNTDSAELIQEYTEHMAGVNTVQFIQDGRMFASTGDDKALRVWDYGVPITVKYVCEPWMHSMPAATMSPNGNYVAYQCLDNSILCYNADDPKYKLNKRKRFRGHKIAGYACVPTFSNDGRYVASGDGAGSVWFWEWKSGKVAKVLEAHDEVCIQTIWHPVETSNVVTCSWDGSIKYWG